VVTTPGALTSLGPLSSTAGSTVDAVGGGVAVDDAGNASWTWERDITGAPGGQYLVEVRDKPAGAALLGAVTLTLAIDGAHAEGPAIDLDPSGRGIISYGFNQSSGPEEIRYSARSSPAGNWAAGTWSTDVRRASQDGQVTVNYGSRVQMGSDGSTVLAYTTSDNKPWAATRLVGQAFGDHHALSDTPGISLSIAVAPNGGAVIAFVKTTVDGALVSARAPGASTFAAAQEVDRAPVAGFTTYVYGIDTAIDGAGNAIAATPDDVCSGACSTFESRIDAVHYDAAPPMLRSVSVPGSALPGATAAFSADAFDQFSTPSIAWDFGDGTSGSGGSASHAFAQPGSYAVKVTATDSLGNATSETRNVTVAFADADGDGAASNVDCDDANPAVRPGAKEIPGNGLDDDCSAGDALKRVGTRLSAAWRVGKRSTAVKRLRLRKLPAGAVVTVGCTGRGCPLKSRRLTFKKARKSASLTGLFNRRVGKRRKHVVVARLRPGTKVTIIVGAPGRAPRTTVYTIRAGKPPAVARA
jgi:PKD repeat protein